jgi:tetratricopeptide (TPR) repeat protein
MNIVLDKSVKHLKAYDGKEPYVFISYARPDSHRVYPILMDLYENYGLRIWYDEGIDAGDDWLDKIALHIKNSAYVICFISPIAIASKYVKGEVTQACSIGKDILMVYLSRTDIQGLAVISGNYQSINMEGDMSNEQISMDLLQYANKCGIEVFDYSKNKKPFFLNGHNFTNPYLARKAEHEQLKKFISSDNSNKILNLIALSGAGKSTFLIKHIQVYYNWKSYGNTVYFSFENNPYLGSFLNMFLSKISYDNIANMSQEEMMQKVIDYLSTDKCTIIFDAVEQLFRGFNEQNEPLLQDNSFLLFINKLLLNRNTKIILSSKMQLSIFNKYPLCVKLFFSDISLSDFEVFLRESHIVIDIPEMEKQTTLNKILTATSNNAAILCLLMDYINKFCRSSLGEMLKSQFFSIESDICINDELFNFYWDKFSKQERRLLESLSLLRWEITKDELLLIADREHCNKLNVLNKLQTFLLINENNSNNKVLYSLHNVFKIAIMRQIEDDEIIKNLHMQISNIFAVTDKNPYRQAEHCWHLLKAGQIGDVSSALFDKIYENACLIDELYFLGAYSTIIDLLMLVIENISFSDKFYAIAYRKTAMAIDKSGKAKESLKYFDEFIRASIINNDMPEYLKGLYYKSEPLYCMGEFPEAGKLLDEVQKIAIDNNIFSSKVIANLSGRKALIALAQNDFLKARELSDKAVKIVSVDEYKEKDKKTLECWWNIVLGKSLLFIDKDKARQHMEKALKLSEEFKDFRAESLYELARINLFNGDIENANNFYRQAIMVTGDNIFIFIKLQLLNIFLCLLSNDLTEAKNTMNNTGIIISNSDYKYLEAVYDMLHIHIMMQRDKYDFMPEIKKIERYAHFNKLTKKYLSSVISINDLLLEIKNDINNKQKILLEIFLCG